MSTHITNDPFLEMLREENSKKARGQKDPFASNPSITDNEFFNPLENRDYNEVLQQMSKTNQATIEETPKTPTLSDLLNTAQVETRNIFKHLGTLKRLANDASDEKQTDSARDFFQRDFFETVGKIDTAAGKMSWDGMVISEGNENYKITQVNLQFAAEKTSSNEGTQNLIQSGNHSIDADGVYTLAKGYSGIVEVSAQNVKIMQENPSTPLKDVSIFGSQKGHANLWIENLNVENSANHRDSVIKFHGEGNVLSLKGNNFIKTSWSESAAIHVGDGLTLNGSGRAALNIDMLGAGDKTSPSAAAIGSNPSENSAANINIKDSIINVNMDSDSGGAGIGSASHHHTAHTPQSSIGDINIQDSTINVRFGGGGSNAPQRPIGDVNIQDSTINVKTGGPNTRGGAGIGSGANARCGNINIDNSVINVNATSGAAIGAGAGSAIVGDIRIGRGAELNLVSRNGAGIGTGFSFFEGRSYFGTVGNIDLDKNAKINASSIGLGNHDPQATPGRIGALNYTNISLTNTNIFVNEPLMDFVNNFRSRQRSNNSLNRPGLLLDDFSNQRPTNEIRLGFMHPRFLGTGNLLSPQGRFLNPFDQNMFDSFFSNTRKQNDWLDIVRGASNQNLSSINLLSQRSASIASRVIEGAMSQVQRELSNISTYIQRYAQPQPDNNTQNSTNNSTNRHNVPPYNFV